MKQSSGWKVLPNNIIEACQIETTKMASAGVCTVGTIPHISLHKV
jgi:hypothetical protein